MNPLHRALKGALSAFLGLGAWVALPPIARAELPPHVLIEETYAGIQRLHNNKAVPKLVWGIPRGYRGGCGPVNGSHFCLRDRTVYIAREDIYLAYEHGDAALAYIVSHEYAHAMQTAFGFRPRSTRDLELQADCLAGAYMGLIPNLEFDRSDIREIGSLAHRLGDYARWHHDHHGTPRQRLQAVMLGMRSVHQGRGVSACMG